MEYLIIIGVLALLGFAINYYQNNILYKKTPFYKLKKRVEEDLEYANFNNDWRQRQEAQLKLLWLDLVLKEERQDTLNALLQREKKTDYEVMKGVLSSDLKFPSNYERDNFLHLKFTQEVMQGYAKLWANPFDHKMVSYKPEAVLPYPKDEMIKAITFFNEFGNYPPNMKENISALLAYLLEFIPIEPDKLPTDHVGNFEAGDEWEEKNKN